MSEKEINNLLVSGEAASNKSSDDLINAAEAYADEQIMDLKEKQNNRKRALIKLGAMGVITVIILIFATIAWFSMNRTVETSGMSVTTADIPFEIAAKGTAVRNDTEFIKADSAYGYGNADYVSGYYATGGSDSQIKIRYTPVANEDTEFGPGSSGTIEFYVIPKQNGDLSVQIDLDVIGYRSLGETTTTVNRISELTTANSGLEQSVIDQYKSADNYLKGHIMFFEEEGDTAESTREASRYYYKKPIVSKTLNKTFTNARKDVPQKVTIHWMWTNTLGQIALKNNDSELRSDYPVVQDVEDDGTDISNTDKAKVIQYLKDNKSTIFENYASVTDSEIDNAKDKANFKKLSDGYNDADYLIGSSVSYFMIDITVKPAS